MDLNGLAGDLGRITGKEHVSTSVTHREIYSYDASMAKGTPGAVVFPGNTAELARIVQAAREAGVPFAPRGFGTNLSGGSVLSSGGLVICLSRMNGILAVDPGRRSAVVQPGVTNLELQSALSPLGFFFAPDPASQKVATLGGNVAENSGGPHCLKYGVTTNHILGLQMVLSSGEIVRIGGSALDPPGYDIRGVVVGSEGTFGIVTEITVRMLPKPESVVTLLAVYDDVSDAARSVSGIITAGIVPATLEMMDALVIRAVEDSYACGYPRDAAAVLIIEVEGPSAGLRDQAQRIEEICSRNGCRDIRQAKDDEERNRLWEGRRGAFGAIARIAPNFLVNDCTVPRTRLPEALSKVAEISGSYGLLHGNVFHAGDGNLHPLLFFDSRYPQQRKQAKEAGWQIMQACVALEGTISGEHGIGLEKLDAMHLVFSREDMEAQRALKRAFDPEGLLNPGKVIPEPSGKKSGPTGEDEHDKASASPGISTTAETKIVERVLRAIESQQSLYPRGRGNHSPFGNVPGGPLSEVDSSDFADVIKLDSANQVVVAGSGMTLQNLQAQLSVGQQWLPIRPPFPREGYTLGGLAALNACGPERLLYGAPRDLLLGLRFVNGTGALVTTGGKVVKNVAGYDMTRLLTGSSGTLGFITELTFRIATVPEHCTAVSGCGTLGACSAAASELVRSSLEPAYVVVLPEDPAADNPASCNRRLLIGFEGFPVTIDYQSKKSTAILARHGLVTQDRKAYRDYDVHQGVLSDYYRHMDLAPFILRISVPMDRVARIMERLSDISSDAEMLADFGCGRIHTAIGSISSKQWSEMCDLALECAGNLALDKAPDGFRAEQDVFGPPRPEWKLTHAIKSALDPHGIFSPGCLPGRK